MAPVGSYSSVWWSFFPSVGCTFVWLLTTTEMTLTGELLQRPTPNPPTPNQKPLFFIVFSCFSIYWCPEFCWLHSALCPVFRKGFSALNMWVNWFMVVIIFSAMFTSYSLLLLVRGIFCCCRNNKLILKCINERLLHQLKNPQLFWLFLWSVGVQSMKREKRPKSSTCLGLWIAKQALVSIVFLLLLVLQTSKAIHF